MSTRGKQSLPVIGATGLLIAFLNLGAGSPAQAKPASEQLASQPSASEQPASQSATQQPATQATQQPRVAIKVHGPASNKEFMFQGHPRLSQVYEQAQLQQHDVFWPGVRLVSADKQQQIKQQQRQLTQDLYQLQRYFSLNNDQSYAQLVGRVAEQISRWPLIGAEPIGRGHVEQGPKNITYGVDTSKKSSLTSSYDEARFNLNANPALTASQYQLLIPSIAQHQMPHLQVIGAVWVPFVMNYHPNFTARETAKIERLHQRLESLTESAEVTQISAAGDVKVIHIAAFNAHKQEFSAGAKILTLFDNAKLPQEFEHINAQMIELARYWNPMQPLLEQPRTHFTTVSPALNETQAGANAATQTAALTSQSAELEKPFLWLGESSKRQQPTTNDMGGWGLLQNPTGRHADQGEFAFTYYDSQEYRRWALNLQLFPWLETTIRYNDIRTRLYSPIYSFSGDQTYKDRGVDVKLRLNKESQWLPEVSVGIRDLAGTGLFASEFIAASKRIGNFDFSAGIGWGYLGKNDNVRNVFCDLSDKFCERPTEYLDEGGNFETDKWFRGPSAWFGGVEYQTPWDPLTLKLEYDSNNYRNDPSWVRMPQDSRWNYGLEYDLGKNMSIKASYERGNTFMFGFTLRTNLDSMYQPKLDSPKRPPQPSTVATAEEFKQPEHIRRVRNAAYNNAGTWIGDMALSGDGETLTMYGNRYRYREREIATEKLGRVLASETPASVKTYQFVDRRGNFELAQENIDAQLFKDAIARNNINATTQQAYSRSEVTEQPGEQIHDHEFSFAKMPTVSVKPYLEQSFGGPESFYMYQAGLDARLMYSLSPDTFVFTTVGLRLADNYDKFNYIAGYESGPLPRVRTYVREYVTASDLYLRNLVAVHQHQFSDSWYGAVNAGYQERMFAGFGGELLYRELDSNWAVGLDLNYARQRDWENHFSLRDYDVITGHLTGYWQPEFLPNTMLKVAAGQFLAGDRGVHLAFEHRFNSGIIVGAFAAKTNVSAEEYGEGSFNKGFYISLPFDLFQLRHSVGRGSIGWAPLTRDGGQMLGRSYSLFGATDKRSPYYGD